MNSLEDCQAGLDYHAKAAAHYWGTWYVAAQYHMDLFMVASKEKERLLEEGEVK